MITYVGNNTVHIVHNSYLVETEVYRDPILLLLLRVQKKDRQVVQIIVPPYEEIFQLDIKIIQKVTEILIVVRMIIIIIIIVVVISNQNTTAIGTASH